VLTTISTALDIAAFVFVAMLLTFTLRTPSVRSGPIITMLMTVITAIVIGAFALLAGCSNASTNSPLIWRTPLPDGDQVCRWDDSRTRAGCIAEGRVFLCARTSGAFVDCMEVARPLEDTPADGSAKGGHP
jgi:hypothetical protein